MRSTIPCLLIPMLPPLPKASTRPAQPSGWSTPRATCPGRCSSDCALRSSFLRRAPRVRGACKKEVNEEETGGQTASPFPKLKPWRKPTVGAITQGNLAFCEPPKLSIAPAILLRKFPRQPITGQETSSYFLYVRGTALKAVTEIVFRR